MSVSLNYIAGRKPWKRPQAMLWADSAPTIAESGKLIPVGYEVGSDLTEISITGEEDTFIILSDHNRSAMEISTERIEQRQRMANGTMRSYHIADKLTISTSWSMLPSRGFEVVPNFNQDSGKPTIILPENKNELPPNTYFAHKSQQFTADGGAGGGEMLDWYESHTGPFWVLLSYDKYNNFGDDNAARTHLSEYSQALQMYISSFTYSVVKRGGDNFDMWDVSVTLEEV
jgi:hypothetical protein